MATSGDISGLDVLAFSGKPMVPRIAMGRARVLGVIDSSANGGLTRQRKKYYNNPYIASAIFDLGTPAKQDFIETFFSRNEGKKFICYLMADRPIVEPYVVQVLGEWRTSGINAISSDLELTLEIVSVRCPELDEYLFNMYQCQGDDFCKITDMYKQIVKAMPNA